MDGGGRCGGEAAALGVIAGRSAAEATSVNSWVTLETVTMVRNILSAVSALSVLCTLPGAAQIRASERSTLSQTIDGTIITLDYARPRLRGRFPIFGTKAVHWDEVWTPGANWATTLETTKPIQLSGRTVPKGKYSVWFVVKESGPWVLVLDPDHHRFHMNPPDSNTAQVRIPVAPGTAPRAEVLTWSFPDLQVGGGKLAMQWGETVVSMDFKVPPSFGIAMSKEDAAPFLGRWSFAWVAVSGQKADTVTMMLTYEKGSLYASYIPQDPYMGKFVLIRIADGSLIPGLFEKGELYEVIRDEVYEFKGPKGLPDSFEVRDDHDELLATGRRLP